MAAGPKEVAGRRDSLPAQEIAADPLQSYCPDLDQWPRSWAYEARDIPYGLQMVECFKPFLREMLALLVSRTTLRRHRDNIWVLGGEVIRRVQMDSGLRRRPVEQVVLDLIGDDGGPLLSHGESETEQRSFDATCRKLSRFLTGPGISRDHHTPSSTAAANRSRHCRHQCRVRGHTCRGQAPQPRSGAPQAQGLTAIRMAEAQLAVPSGAALPANSSAPSWATGIKRAARYTPSNTHNFPRGTE